MTTISGGDNFDGEWELALLTSPPDDDILVSRREVTLAIDDQVIEDLARGVAAIDVPHDMPWQLQGLVISYDEEELESEDVVRVHFVWVPLDVNGYGHPVDALRGYYAPQPIIGLAFVGQTQIIGESQSHGDEQTVVVALADGRPCVVTRDSEGSLTTATEAISGRLLDAMLAFFCALVPPTS